MRYTRNQFSYNSRSTIGVEFAAKKIKIPKEEKVSIFIHNK